MYARTLFTVMLGCLLPLQLDALPWSKDMRDQAAVKAQEARVETPSTSVPTTGEDPVSPPKDPTELVLARLQAGAQLQNPVRKTPESVNRGKAVYDLHCGLCHGPGGLGDGLVGQKYVPDPMNLTLDYVQLQPDGQIFYTISHGSIAMPYYRDSIPQRDRWHVINYMKLVFGQKPE